jgi:uroporphyrinogen-III synthase
MHQNAMLQNDMTQNRADAVVLSSARMAAGMTSRARRPESRLAG